MASNTPFGKIGDYPVYGYNCRQVSETSMTVFPSYYPANHAADDVSLGGYGIFRVDGNKYCIKPGDGFIRAGNYRLVFTW